MLVEKCNGNLIPPAGCLYISGSHHSLLLFLPLETEPRFVGDMRKEASSPTSAVTSHENATTREGEHLLSYLKRSGVGELVPDKGFMLF